jgi:hypothetical protein
MAGKITLWGAGELLRTFFSGLSTPPDAFYLALVKDIAPTPYVSGAELSEPDFEEYARVQIPNDSLTWTNEGQVQTMVCEADVEFIAALQDWGTVRFWAICNAPVDGYVYFVGNFEDPEIISTGDSVLVSAGNLSVSLGPFFSEEE